MSALRHRGRRSEKAVSLTGVGGGVPKRAAGLSGGINIDSVHEIVVHAASHVETFVAFAALDFHKDENSVANSGGQKLRRGASIGRMECLPAWPRGGRQSRGLDGDDVEGAAELVHHKGGGGLPSTS